MKILFLMQYCTPEIAFKSVPFARELKNKGHNVIILTGFPNMPFGRIYQGYKIKPWDYEEIDGIPIYRVVLFPSHDQSYFKRMLNYFSFALSASLLGLILVPKIDVIYVYHPPSTVFLPALLFKWIRRIPLVFDILDVWPYQLSDVRLFDKNKLGYKILDLFCTFAYKQASKIIVPSPGYKRIVENVGISADKIVIIHNWCNEKLINSRQEGQEKALNSNKENQVILFTGNMGDAQALNTILEVANILQKKNMKISFHFVGDGINKARLLQIAKERNLRNVHFFPPCPQTEIKKYYDKADILLVHLKKNPIYDISIPSKIADYLFIGKPIIAGVRGDAADIIKKAKAGIVCDPEDPFSISNAAEKLYYMPCEKLNEMGKNGQRFYEQELSVDIGIRKFEAIFNSVVVGNSYDF